MTPKEQKFCDEYLTDLNATQAAIRAGYSQKSARQIGADTLSKPYIQDYIDRKRAELQARTQITQDWVLNRFKEISDRCMQAEPVMIRGEDGQMEPSGEYEFDSAGANKATEMIAKHIGFFEQDNKQQAPSAFKHTVEFHDFRDGNKAED